MGLADALRRVRSSHAKRLTHRPPGLGRVFGLWLWMYGAAPLQHPLGAKHGRDLLHQWLTGPKPPPSTPCEAGSARMRVVSPAAAWPDSEDTRRWRSQRRSAQRSSTEFVWF